MRSTDSCGISSACARARLQWGPGARTHVHLHRLVRDATELLRKHVQHGALVVPLEQVHIAGAERNIGARAKHSKHAAGPVLLCKLQLRL